MELVLVFLLLAAAHVCMFYMRVTETNQTKSLPHDWSFVRAVSEVIIFICLRMGKFTWNDNASYLVLHNILNSEHKYLD